MVELAKPALDVGLNTNNLDNMLAFWQDQAYVPFSEMLPLGGGRRQHRHAIGESVLKINHGREAAPQSTPSGLHKLTIYSDAVDEGLELLDPDGNELELLPQQQNAQALNLCLHLQVNSLPQTQDFYGTVLGLPAINPTLFQVGASAIQLSPSPKPIAPVSRDAVGFRYMTLQVYDVVQTHQQILERGGTEGMAPIRLGDVAYISFVRDPDGNWIEISQRKSITGSLD